MLRSLMLTVTLALLAGCATLRNNSGLAAHPTVQGTLHVASRDQCAEYAAAHPEDAAATADYLRALRTATEGCLSGLAPQP